MALMQIDPSKPPLYGSAMLSYLRGLERQGLPVPSFDHFRQEFTKKHCSLPGQAAAAEQRFGLLEPLVSDPSSSSVTPTAPLDFDEIFQKNRLVIFDITDPFLTESDANVIFFVILNMFRELQLDKVRHPTGLSGKFAVFDEAHKFFVDRTSRLCHEIVSLVEVMRLRDPQRCLRDLHLCSAAPFPLATSMGRSSAAV